MEKKGVSAVLATIILIFILMVIVSLVVGFSNNFFGLLKDSSTLSPLYQKLKITIDSATIGTGETITIIVTRQDNEDILLKGIRFKFRDMNSNSYTYDLGDPPADPGMSKPYTITNTELGIATFSEINQVSISAVTPEGKQTNILDEREI